MVRLRRIGLVIAVLFSGCSGDSDELSADQYRATVVSLCEQPLTDLENSAPTSQSSPTTVAEWARHHRRAANRLRALDGPAPEEDEGRDLARRMDEMAEELDAAAAAVGAGDDNALSEAVGAGARVRSGIIAACSAFEHFERG
jgi:uncharacterized protein YigA (DUF484 family)